MDRKIKTFLLSLLTLFLMGGLLGCTVEFVGTEPESTTEESSTDGDTLIEIMEEDTEEDGTVTVNLGNDSEWSNYEVTTNEIDYDPFESYVDEDGYYTSEVDVATYIIQYNTLPENFVTKKEAKKEGWTGGSVEPYFGDDMCIGGDYFGNYEKVLPEVDGRTYHECDIDTMGKKGRGSKRIIYSNDGQIYYTDDHYESFTLIYGTDHYN